MTKEMTKTATEQILVKDKEIAVPEDVSCWAWTEEELTSPANKRLIVSKIRAVYFILYIQYIQFMSPGVSSQSLPRRLRYSKLPVALQGVPVALQGVPLQS